MAGKLIPGTVMPMAETERLLPEISQSKLSVVSNTLVKSVRWSTSAMLKSAEIWKFAPTSPVMLMSGILMEPSVPLFQAMFKPLGKEITASTATYVSVL